jgi:ParB family chromosome partitioning protein
MELRHVPIGELSIAAVNMRHGRKAPHISDILPSVRARGILQPLLVRPHGEGYEIVAGRRRYFAAKAVEQERGKIDPLPCAILAPGDDAGALEASLIENIARLDPDEVSQWETFVRLIREGKTVPEIAATFGITDLIVKRRLALGNLLPKIRDAYRREELDAQTIRHLTMASKAQQKAWLKLLEGPQAYAPQGRQLKSWLFGGQSISTKVALFPLEDYTGPIVTDLFGEEGYFGDADRFWELQDVAIAAKREALLAAGWSAVEVLETGRRFHDWEHVKTPKRRGGKVFISVSEQGEVEVHEGWLATKEARRLARQKGLDEDAAAPAGSSHPAMTKAMTNYLELHRHAVVRLALLARPDAAFRLMVAHAVAASGRWQVRAEPQQARSEAIAASLAANPAQQAFETERVAILGLLDLPQESSAVAAANGNPYRTAAVFGRLLTLSEEEVRRVAAFVMAETLAAESALVEALGRHLEVDARQDWRPDDVFFDLMLDRPTVNAILAEVAGKAVADANLAERGKVQKQIIRDCLDGAGGRAQIEGWIPGWMAFLFRGYSDGTCPLSEAVGRIDSLFPES